MPRFSVTDLVEAEAATGETYLQLPDDLPERIHQVAEQFKVSRSPYLKAYQIMLFLEEELTYEFDEPEVEPGQPPAGSDPVDWFLFEQRVGGAGNFSSAFVALARAAGIPARVVSGWVIEENLGPQVVYADQSHQWAEIALEGVGWITFDPGAQASRAQEFEEPLAGSRVGATGGERRSNSPRGGGPSPGTDRRHYGSSRSGRGYGEGLRHGCPPIRLDRSSEAGL